MIAFYSDEEFDQLIASLKLWLTYPNKELTELTKLSRVTVSKWLNGKGNINADNQLLLWKSATKLISDKKRKWAQQKK
ncbi:MAG: hypothetical protein AAFQ94_18535 [Bacteroidota bacterium]